MLTYKGKYNVANVMIDCVEEELVSQLYSMLNHPAFENGYIAIMPDTHAGKGSCVGFTKKMNEYVIPNVIGVDIGCGVSSYNLGNLELNEKDFGALEGFIRQNIPTGFSVRNNIIKDFGEGLGAFSEQVEDICFRMSQDLGRVKRSVGSLGGGNHFCELDISPKGDVWLTIHTGSRNFGERICKYYQDKAKNLMNKMFIGDAYKNLEFLPVDMEDGKNYLKDMGIAQKYAKYNRYTICKIIIEDFFKMTLKDIENIECVHNYINFDDNIIRKGAISAHAGERVLIPLNMFSGVIVGTGNGNPKWNFSAPHGAGRILSRKKAKMELSLEKMKEIMNGIWSKSITMETLDESPEAYKDSDMIIDAVRETVDIDFVMKPIYVLKDTTPDRKRGE